MRSFPHPMGLTSWLGHSSACAGPAEESPPFPSRSSFCSPCFSLGHTWQTALDLCLLLSFPPPYPHLAHPPPTPTLIVNPHYLTDDSGFYPIEAFFPLEGSVKMTLIVSCVWSPPPPLTDSFLSLAHPDLWRLLYGAAFCVWRNFFFFCRADGQQHNSPDTMHPSSLNSPLHF